MALDDYKIAPGSTDWFLEEIRECAATRRRCRIVVRGSGELIGVPAEYTGGSKIVLRDGDGNLHSVPLAQLELAERQPVLDDGYFMGLAIEVARKSMQEPNKKDPKPRVGAVLVRGVEVVETAYRGELKGGEHAEYTLLERKLENHTASLATLYTTLEPCTKRGSGKTPCVDHIIRRNIQRVVIGMLDPNQKIRGEGVWILREKRIEVSLCDPFLMAQIEEDNRKFVARFRPRVPPGIWTRLKRLVGAE